MNLINGKQAAVLAGIVAFIRTYVYVLSSYDGLHTINSYWQWNHYFFGNEIMINKCEGRI